MMAALVSTGSPKLNRRATPRAAPQDIARPQGFRNSNERSATLSNNSNIPDGSSSGSASAEGQVANSSSHESADGVSNILARLRLNDTRQSISQEFNASVVNIPRDFDQLISEFDDNHKILRQQEAEIKGISGHGSSRSSNLSSNSEAHVTTQDEIQPQVVSYVQNPKVQVDNTELVRIKQELETAKSIINRQEMELNESRNLKHTMEQAMGPSSEIDYPLHAVSHPAAMHARAAFDATARPFMSLNEAPWSHLDNVRDDLRSPFAGGGLMSTHPPTHAPIQSAGSNGIALGMPNNNNQFPKDFRLSTYGHQAGINTPISPVEMSFASNRTFINKPDLPLGMDERLHRSFDHNNQHPILTRPVSQVRSSATFHNPLSPVLNTNLNVSAFNGNGQYGFLDRSTMAPISPISPTSPEFPQLAGQCLIPTAHMNGQTYVSPLEPMNYRRLLDKSVSCDWKYIVDKIVCNNDQQASIFLQQKLKVGTAEQKYEIVESIVNQAYPLMINRFGNFLVQRCFEHGTPDQVIAIANAIHGNVISLSMDPFGCHVIQKAFDSVPEDHKADMVRELLRRIPDTVIHRYACHVWQKLFELRWTGEPPQIMLKVNEALRGMWHEVALGETGSLVVQNIFENCVEEEKRPAIEEVISHIDLIAHGQFGNWCIQHLCEHGSPSDKRRVIDHILINSYSYSIDQFASKVVEKCLKIGGPEFMDRYLSAITTTRPDRPRIPLIDIAGDQYGNYLIQWILMNTHQHQREQVAIHIRKHMVSLRGSKFGSRVAMLCSNPAASTRPGPATTMVNPYNPPNQQTRSAPWPRYR